MINEDEIPYKWFENLAVKQLGIAKEWIGSIPPSGQAALLIEICRNMDFLHVHKAFSKEYARLFTYPDLD